MNIDLETKLQTVTWEKEQAMQNGDAVCRAADAQIKQAKEEYTRQLSFLQTQLDAAMKSQSSTHTVEMHKDVVGSTPEAR